MKKDISDSELVFPPALLPVELDGSCGTNRSSTARPLIAAKDDLSAISVWLAEYGHSPHTLRAYRKEALRLLLWATRTRHKPVSSLSREDLIGYEALERRHPISFGNGVAGGCVLLAKVDWRQLCLSVTI
jgi:integrase/recombinase XerC